MNPSLDATLKNFLQCDQQLELKNSNFALSYSQYVDAKSEQLKAENDYYSARKDLLNALIESGELPVITANIDMINSEKGDN